MGGVQCSVSLVLSVTCVLCAVGGRNGYAGGISPCLKVSAYSHSTLDLTLIRKELLFSEV